MPCLRIIPNKKHAAAPNFATDWEDLPRNNPTTLILSRNVLFTWHLHTSTANTSIAHVQLNVVIQVLWCLFTTSALWMVKILTVKVAANSFHRAAYFDRVQDCLFHQYVLETLSAPRVEDPHWTTPDHGSHDDPPPHASGRRAGELQQQHHHQQHVSSGKHPESHSGFPGQHHQRSTEKLETTVEEEPPEPRITLARAPSRNYLGMSPSRRNLTSTSRMNLGGTAPYATRSQLHSPLGRVRRVSVNTEPTSFLARSAVPIGQDKLQELTSEVGIKPLSQSLLQFRILDFFMHFSMNLSRSWKELSASHVVQGLLFSNDNIRESQGKRANGL